jgi:hypothetical protein
MDSKILVKISRSRRVTEERYSGAAPSERNPRPRLSGEESFLYSEDRLNRSALSGVV